MIKHEIEHLEGEQMFFVDIEEQRAYMRYRLFKEPLANTQEPSAGIQEPSAGIQEPSAGIQEPSADIQEPSANANRSSAYLEVDFYTTFVPDSLRGQGVAAQLVESGFAWADEQGLEIKSSCWYAAKKLERRLAGR